jgi:glycosyltransferase involved in cell wall biosynthesis
MEGFSIALCEALACGTPVVGWAAQVEELEMLWHRPVGLPFDARKQTAEELEALILQALASPVTEDSSRTQLSRLARESFSMERYGGDMIGHYAELLGVG